VKGSESRAVIEEYALPDGASGPYGIATGPDRALWFTEMRGGRIGRITTEGEVSAYPLPTANAGPATIAAGPDGALWFTEHRGNKIGRVSTDGSVEEYPLPTLEAGPFGITAGPDGALWFTELGANRIGRITTDGAPNIRFRRPRLVPPSSWRDPTGRCGSPRTRATLSGGSPCPERSWSTRCPLPRPGRWVSRRGRMGPSGSWR
jgi:virginiamycin B lyase